MHKENIPSASTNLEIQLSQTFLEKLGTVKSGDVYIHLEDEINGYVLHKRHIKNIVTREHNLGMHLVLQYPMQQIL